LNTYRHNKVITQKSYHNEQAIHIPNNSKSIFLKRNTITIRIVNWGNKNNDNRQIYYQYSAGANHDSLSLSENPKMVEKPKAG
jgi:hypothetical protein